ncbi:hypothetical protein TKK_0003659 [Trichogramma kaykai]
MAIVIDQLSDEESFDEDDAETENRAFAAEAQRIKSNLLPTKSRGQYEKAYSAFIHWKTENRRSSSEDDLLVYFDKLSALYKPPTLWSHWSKLKSLMILKENINLDQYLLLKNLLKIKSKGYKPKKSAVLTMEQVQKFLIDSNDDTYLAMEAILIFGIFGYLRCKEFLNILTTDITDTGSQYIVLIRDTKTGIDRNFVIGQQYYGIIKAYLDLRPSDMPSNRLFVYYNKGKCTRQFIGKNTLSGIPKIIAQQLNLPDPDSYTGHCFRRSSATILSNTGANLNMVKKHGGWSSDTVAQGYLAFSIAERTEIFNKMAGPSSTEIQPPLQRNNMKKTSSVQPQIHASAQEQPSTSKYNLKTTPPVQSVTRTSAQKPPPRNGCNLEKRPFTYTVADDIENIDPADSPSQKMIDNFMNNDDPSEEALFQEITLDYHHTGNDVNETSAKRKKISNDNSVDDIISVIDGDDSSVYDDDDDDDIEHLYTVLLSAIMNYHRIARP